MVIGAINYVLISWNSSFNFIIRWYLESRPSNIFVTSGIFVSRSFSIYLLTAVLFPFSFLAEILIES